jgi:hypothetical protein
MIKDKPYQLYTRDMGRFNAFFQESVYKETGEIRGFLWIPVGTKNIIFTDTAVIATYWGDDIKICFEEEEV